jgi:hypothetical protein
MKIGWGLPKYLVFAVLISALVFPWFQGVNAIGDINAQENSTDITNTTNTLNISTTTSATNEAVTNVSAVPANTTTSILTNTSINVTTTNTSTMTTAATGVENVTTDITTITVVSYITLPPVTRPPSNVEIARWLSGGVIAGILVGLSIGYAFFAKGVSIKRQQVGGKGVKAGERMEKRRK